MNRVECTDINSEVKRNKKWLKDIQTLAVV